jgi:membrane-bound ClpP family serine protease
MSEEKVIYEKGNIKITNMRAIFGDKTYAVSNITSVTKKEKTTPFSFLPVGIIVFGIAFITISFFNNLNGALMILGVFMVIGGYFVAMLLRTEYFIQLGSAAGDTEAYTSKDIAEIEKIVQAINQAMIQQG